MNYTKLRKQQLNKYPVCQANIYNCTIKSTDIHHMQGRGKYYLDISTWLCVCRNCHVWITEHPEDAKELNLSKSRL
jgi:hypothetical protein